MDAQAGVHRGQREGARSPAVHGRRPAARRRAGDAHRVRVRRPASTRISDTSAPLHAPVWFAKRILITEGRLPGSVTGGAASQRRACAQSAVQALRHEASHRLPPSSVPATRPGSPRGAARSARGVVQHRQPPRRRARSRIDAGAPGRPRRTRRAEGARSRPRQSGAEPFEHAERLRRVPPRGQAHPGVHEGLRVPLRGVLGRGEARGQPDVRSAGRAGAPRSPPPRPASRAGCGPWGPQPVPRRRPWCSTLPAKKTSVGRSLDGRHRQLHLVVGAERDQPPRRAAAAQAPPSRSRACAPPPGSQRSQCTPRCASSERPVDRRRAAELRGRPGAQPVALEHGPHAAHVARDPPGLVAEHDRHHAVPVRGQPLRVPRSGTRRCRSRSSRSISRKAAPK